MKHIENSTMLHNVTPEKFKDEILKGIDERLSELSKQFQPKEPPEYYTRKELKEKFKVDYSTLYNWEKKGLLKAYGIGGRVYYKRHEVDSMLIPLKY